MRVILFLILCIFGFGFSASQSANSAEVDSLTHILQRKSIGGNPQSTGTYFVQDNYPDDSLETNPLLSYIAVDERATHNARVLLYNALKNENLEPDELLQLIEPENPDDPFVTNYEKLQLYFIAQKYDLAIDHWINKYIADEPQVKHFPSAPNVLGDYLNKRMSLKDSNNVKVQLHLIEESKVSLDQKALIKIIAHFPLGFRCRRTNCRWTPIHSISILHEPSVEAYKKSFSQLDSFKVQFPKSKYIPQVVQIKEILEQNLADNHYYLDPAQFKIYTGGIGIEVFAATDASFHAALALQYKRGIIALTGTTGFYVTWGYVLYDSRIVKFHPFIGAGGTNEYGGLILGGAQTDFRFGFEKGVDSKFSTQGHLALKLRYMGGYSFKKNGYVNMFMIGLGAHLW